MRRAPFAIACLSLAVLVSTALAADHPLLLADATVVKPGTRVALRHALCQPFAGKTSPIMKPMAAAVQVPDGSTIDLIKELPPDAPPSDWQLAFMAQVPGDHVIMIHGQPFDENEMLYQDFVKLIIHVDGSERGWERQLRTRLEVVPLTRPYGLPVGSIFRGMITESGKPVASSLVRCEPWNEKGGGENVPAHKQHRLERTGPSGEFAVTFDKPGFWMLSAEFNGRQVQKGGQRMQEVLRAGLWVKVGD
jgi:cobalt/nickel transport protein